MADPFTLYKLIILYMLNRVDYPLTRAQVCNFILGKEYTNYLTLQSAFGELIEAGFITTKSLQSRTHLFLTDDGKQTLAFFDSQISSSIKKDIDEYLKEHAMELKEEASILADYYKATSGEYEAHLVAKDKGINLVDLTISVPSEETAVSICDNWQNKNQQIYQYLIEQLF